MRAAPADAGGDADLRRDMIDRDMAEIVRRHGAGGDAAVRAEEAARGVQPLGASPRRVGRGDPRPPAMDAPARHGRAHPRRGRRARSVSALDFLDARPDDLRRLAERLRDDRRLLDRRRLELAPIAAADQGRVDRHRAFGNAERPRRRGAGEAGRQGRRPDFQPVAGVARGRGQRLDRRRRGRGRSRSAPRSGCARPGRHRDRRRCSSRVASPPSSAAGQRRGDAALEGRSAGTSKRGRSASSALHRRPAVRRRDRDAARDSRSAGTRPAPRPPPSQSTAVQRARPAAPCAPRR